MTRHAEPTLYAFADGACSGNPGPGGYAWILLAMTGSTVIAQKDGHGHNAHSTNQRCELLAAIDALHALTRPTAITVVSDSKYLIDGASAWLDTWINNGWRTSKKQAVENRDLWETIAQLRNTHQITWCWTKGHSKDPDFFSRYNREVDGMAVEQRDLAKQLATP